MEHVDGNRSGRTRAAELVDLTIEDEVVTVSGGTSVTAHPPIVVSANLAALVCETDVDEILARIEHDGAFTCTCGHGPTPLVATDPSHEV